MYNYFHYLEQNSTVLPLGLEDYASVYVVEMIMTITLIIFKTTMLHSHDQ